MRLDDLGWTACLRCMVSVADDDTPPVLDGFEDLRELGRGGMGVVYRAYQRRLDREVAIKVIDTDRACDPAFRERFAREAKLMARLAHPNVAAVHELGEQGGLYFLVMEFVDGAPLGHVPVATALRIVDALCDALVAAHALGIVHRDIKPSNVLVRSDGTVKLIDFGIATALATESTQLTRTGQVIGTPAFMAPEAQRGLAASPAMDVYAVALLLRVITNDAPLPPRIERVIDRALSARAVDRPSIVELRHALHGGPRRQRRLVLVALALLATGGAGVESRADVPTLQPPSEVPIVPDKAVARDTLVAPVVVPAKRRIAAKPTHAAPTPAPGTLSLRVRPWAMVSIDGAPAVRVEPPKSAHVLPPGAHVVELSNPVTGKRERREVEIIAGETASLVVSLEADR